MKYKKLDFKILTKISLGFFKVVITSSVAFSASTFLNFASYKSYWNGTIFAVQTVDFNILSHTLPTKLSYALQRKNIDEVQNTLNSNFGLFGIVITNCKTKNKECPNQKILYSSKSRRDWEKQLDTKDLFQHPYDLLRSPIPLNTENKYTSTRATERRSTGKKNSGRIIGRVYYVRGIPPEFQQDYWRWLQNPLSTSGAHKYYFLTTSVFLFGGFTVLSIIEFLLYKRHKNQEQLKQEVKLLQYQLNGEQRTKALLQSEIQELNTDLERKKKELSLKNEEQFLLETHIQDLQDQTKLNQETISLLQTQLEQVKLLTESDENAIAQLEKEIADKQQKDVEIDLVAQMQQELEHLYQQRDKNYQKFNLLRDKLKDLSLQKKLDEEYISDLELQLADVQQEKEIYNQSYNELKQQISEVEAQKLKAEDLVSQVQEELQLINQQNKNQLDVNNSLSLYVTQLGEELNQERRLRQREEQLVRELKKQLEEYYQQDEEDNLFEKEIKQYLLDNITPLFPDSRILTSFDVASGVQASRVVDIIIILNSYCVITIEAKSYKGQIRSDGYARNNKWYCYLNNNKKISIKSASFTNPYTQILKYSQTIGKKLDYCNKKYAKVNVYGLIVFPQKANISQIKNMFGSYYEVININDLITVLQSLKDSKNGLGSRYQALSTQQIENILRGKIIIQNN
ncbi:NERD domain-containing protein [Nostoc sp. MS1]|uniref:NERD domain-containing protein n=1 Tax=Nostoc sp. MS1 TaxID=2764711 RepID=UPI001CC75D3E|nr:nuclease-related domain-containing protein [Nostoc sp. MS1]BCL40116.1 hypothetical protein NSMS1_65630 [Nostoc sp. MS1]